MAAPENERVDGLTCANCREHIWPAGAKPELMVFPEEEPELPKEPANKKAKKKQVTAVPCPALPCPRSICPPIASAILEYCWLSCKDRAMVPQWRRVQSHPHRPTRAMCARRPLGAMCADTYFATHLLPGAEDVRGMREEVCQVSAQN